MQLIPQAYAQTEAWESINANCVNNGVATIQGFGCMMANVLSIFLTLLGFVGLIMIIYAAFNMMLMGGNSQATEKSKNTITMAVLGIILALSSFIIINLVAEFTGIDAIKNFSLYGSGKNWGSSGTANPAPPEIDNPIMQ